MRAIKFRGKDVDTGEWLYGDLFQRIGFYPQIIEPFADDNGKIAYRGIAVHENTVGQFTGLLDKNGKEIYEGDIIHLGDPQILYVVLWIDCGLKAKQLGCYGSFCGVTYWADVLTIVGNIHDNPKLLKGYKL